MLSLGTMQERQGPWDYEDWVQNDQGGSPLDLKASESVQCSIKSQMPLVKIRSHYDV